jgi:hypothetical protein
MHNDELHNLYSTKHYQGDQIKEGEIDDTYSTHAGDKKCIFLSEEKRSFGRTDYRWKNKINM